MNAELIKAIVRSKYFYLFLLPAVIWYVVFYYVPMYGITIAFKEYSITEGVWASPWVGLEHFRTMWSSPEFTRVLRNTIVISGLKLAFVFTSGIVLALALHDRFKKAVQNITYLPHFLSWVIIGSIMVELLSPFSGLVNKVILMFGGDPIYFLAEEKWFVPMLILSDIWQSCGWGSIIYLAAIAGVDPQLYEAATVDGAGRFRKMVSITLPSIASVIFSKDIRDQHQKYSPVENMGRPRIGG